MLGADMTHYRYCTATAVFLAILANFTIARADIFRWDNSQLIPGTEGITLGPGVQLNDLDLAFSRLTQVNLTGANLSNANLANAAFFGTNLKDANFSGANVLGTSFIGTANDQLGLTAQQLYSTASYQAKNLRGINLSAIPVWFNVESNLRGWDFSGQDLRGAYFGSAWLDDADFSNANLVDVQFGFGSFDSYRATLKNSNLAGADTRGATGLNLTGASTTNMIRPDGRIHGLDLKAGEKLLAYGGVAVPLRLDADLSIAAGGTFDLTDNVAIVDYAGTRPAASIRQQIVSGRGGVGPGGKWTGMGITSSTAAAANAAQPDSRSLGYADNATMPLGPYESFHGATVDATSILIAYTRTGDANLDGIVNDLDVTIVSAFYAPGMPQPAWALGDFDYNGFVDDDDVTLLGALFDPSAPPLNSQAAPGAGESLHSHVTSIPEPPSAMLALLMAIVVVAVRVYARSARCFVPLIAAYLITASVARGDVFRWDNGELVPGTKGITPGPGVQLTERDLKFAQLWDMDLTGANFSRANLTDARFHQATMTNVDFTGALVTGTMFFGLTSRGFTPEQFYSTASYQAKDLRRIIMFDNDLAGWDFSGQNLDGADFTGARLFGAKFSGAVVSGVNFEITEITQEQLHSTASYQAKDLHGIGLIRLDLAGWDFAGQNLSGARFFDSNLIHADFTGATVSGANFESSGLSREQLYSTASYQAKDLQGTALSRLNLAEWDFSEQDLTGANFRSATLSGASFVGAIIAGADFQDTTSHGFTKEQLYATASYQAKDLRGVSFGVRNWVDPTNDLSGWDFRGQNLSGANLFFTNLSNADLTGANLTGALLLGTVLANANLTNATLVESTLVPFGLTKEQFYSTASYQARDLHGIEFRGIDLSGWDLRGQNLVEAFFSSTKLATTNFTDANLTGARFYEAKLAGANLTRVDARGALDMDPAGAITTNLIRPNGLVVNLNLAGGETLIANPDVPIPIQLSANFILAPAATLDLTSNAAIVDYPGISAATKVREQILVGRNVEGLGGKWTGTGITSSTAAAANLAAPDSRSLGYADNASMPLGGYTAYHGTPVDESSILIAYTRTGDANLDGVVNDDDVTIVGTNYAPGVSQPSWALGDFDYNGFVDDDDVTLLGAFYDPSAMPVIGPPAEPGANAEPGAQGVAAVPEPSAVILLGVAIAAGLVTAMRRRRS